MERLNLPNFSLMQGLVLPIALIGIYYIGSVIYCLFFHPLAQYPGPFLAKFSVWPSYYHSTTGDRHIWIWQCHQKYGPIFRSGPNTVLFNSPTANRAIYGVKSNVKKDDFHLVYAIEAGVSNTWFANHAEHARKRRILNAAFSEEALRMSEPYVIQHVDRWCQLLAEGAGHDWSQPREMAEWSDYLVFDILGDLCYAKSFEMKEPGENPSRMMPKFMADYTELHFNAGRSPWLKQWLWLKPRGLDRLFKMFAPENVSNYIRFIESNLSSRIAME